MRKTASGQDFGYVGAWWKTLKSFFFLEKKAEKWQDGNYVFRRPVILWQDLLHTFPYHSPQNCASSNLMPALLNICVRYTNKVPIILLFSVFFILVIPFYSLGRQVSVFISHM